MRIWQTLEEHKRKGCLKRKINELKTDNEQEHPYGGIHEVKKG